MEDDAASRRMIASWTDSLLRLRSRPVANPPRGEWRFAGAPARDAKAGYRVAPALQN